LYIYRYFGGDQIGLIESVKVVTVRPPYYGNLGANIILSKSYIWWSDDPWAALVALAAISVLLCIVGIIVLVFTHSR